MKIVDARGLSCPEPVMMTEYELIHKTPEFTVLASEPMQMERIARLARDYDRTAEVKEVDSEFEIVIR